MGNPLAELTKIKTLIGNIGKTGKDLQAQRQSILRQIEDELAMPLPKKDVIESLHLTVDAGTSEFIDRLQTHLHTVLKTGNPLEGIPGHFPLLCPNSGRPWTDILGVAVFGLFNREVKEAISRIIADMEWPVEAGPPLAERRDKLEKLNKALAAVESQIEELQSAAESAGVQFK